MVQINEILSRMTLNSLAEGPFMLHRLLLWMREKNVDGVARCEERDRSWYILFLNGEPEGAVYTDEKGTLFGSKAMFSLKGGEYFTFYPGEHDIIDSIAVGCRILDRSVIPNISTANIPDIGTRSAGIGILQLFIVDAGVPVPGIPVTIRKEQQIIGSDVTSRDGRVSFRLLFGDYRCVIMDSHQMIRTFPVLHNPPGTEKTIDIEKRISF